MPHPLHPVWNFFSFSSKIINIYFFFFPVFRLCLCFCCCCCGCLFLFIYLFIFFLFCCCDEILFAHFLLVFSSSPWFAVSSQSSMQTCPLPPPLPVSCSLTRITSWLNRLLHCYPFFFKIFFGLYFWALLSSNMHWCAVLYKNGWLHVTHGENWTHYFTSWECFKPVLTCDFSFQSEWLQVSSVHPDSVNYSTWF